MNQKIKLQEHESLRNLNKFNYKIFIGESEEKKKICRFFLMLCHIFNDFAILNWAWYCLKEYIEEPEKNKINYYAGVYYNIYWYLIKIFCSHFTEVLKAFDTEDAKEVLKSPYFSQILLRLNKEKRDIFNNFIKIIYDNSIREKFLLSLEKIRNNLGYHYYQPKSLEKGFLSFFEADKEKMCYFSKGTALSESRFYFIDAAIQKSIFDYKIDDYIKEIELLLKSILIFNDLILIFIQERIFELEKIYPDKKNEFGIFEVKE